MINLNQAVFTTKYILEDKQPILWVVCDEDGEWQFLGGQDVDMENMMIVSFQNILDYDASIKNVFDLQPNMEAKRERKNEDWTITNLNA